MKQGIITKGVGGFYDVIVGQDIIRCRARGIFRKDNIVPMVGDKVKISLKDKAIMEILPRRNQLLRPTVANIDVLGVVLTPTHPAPDFYLADKLMINAENDGIKVILLINKIDLTDDNGLNSILNTYKSTNYPIIQLSCKKKLGFERLHEHIKNNVVTLAGQSGVGKTSIINVLYPEKELETGQLSDKISRGRHTTRHTRLLVLPQGGMLVDTPGFSTMNMSELMPEDLPYLYPDFSDHMYGCRFNGCMHDKEPGCMVKEAVSSGFICQERYKRYIRILNELKEFRRNIW